VLNARATAAGAYIGGGGRRGQRRHFVRDDAPAGAGGAQDGRGIAVVVVLVLEAAAVAAGAGAGHDVRGGRCGPGGIVGLHLEWRRGHGSFFSLQPRIYLWESSRKDFVVSNVSRAWPDTVLSCGGDD